MISKYNVFGTTLGHYIIYILIVLSKCKQTGVWKLGVAGARRILREGNKLAIVVCHRLNKNKTSKKLY